MKSVLVTGALGFVGANLTRRLLADGHTVHALVHAGQNMWRLDDILDHVRLHETALSHPRAMDRLIEEVQPEWVFHLAAHGAYPTQQDYRKMVVTNVLGTMTLVEACVRHGSEALVNSGSSSEYGFKDHPPAEAEAVDPNSHYAVTKAAATMYCRHMAIANDAHILTLRLYSVYGPYEEPTRLWPTLIVHALAGRLPSLAGPEIARDFVYVDDVVDAYLKAAAANRLPRGTIFNVGSGKQTTLRNLVKMVRRELKVEVEPEWGSMPGRSWDTRTWVSDVTSIRQTLEWTPRSSLEDGLRSFIEWFRGNPRTRAMYERHIDR